MKCPACDNELDELQEHLSRAYRSFFYHRIRSLLVDPFQLVRKVHSWEDLRYLVGLMMTGLRMFARLLSLKTFNNEMTQRRIRLSSENIGSPEGPTRSQN